MKAELSIKLLSYFAPNCPRRIVAPNCPRRIVQRRNVRAELSAPNCPAPNCPGTGLVYSLETQFSAQISNILIALLKLFSICRSYVSCLKIMKVRFAGCLRLICIAVAGLGAPLSRFLEGTPYKFLNE